MINVAVWDDDKSSINDIKKITKYISTTEFIDIEVKLITTDSRKLQTYAKKPKMSISDISLYIIESEAKTKMDGIEIARQIRKIDPLCYIIFVSNKEEYSFYSCKYSIKASEYFVKPVGTQELKTIIMHIVNEHYKVVASISRNQTGIVTFTAEYKTIAFNVSDIIAVEYKRPRTIIYSVQGQCITYYTLKEVEEKIKKSDTFQSVIRSHSGYIANLSNVKYVDLKKSTLIMKNDMVVPVARARKKEVKAIYEKLTNKVI